MRKTTLWLLGIALAVRAVIAFAQVRYGINPQINFDVYLYGGFNSGFEIFHDFYYYYLIQLANLSNGLLPYTGFAYSYTPLFLYILYPFYSGLSPQAAALPIIVADAMCSPLVYLSVKKIQGSKLATIAGLVYAIFPISLLYEGYIWFSSQPMTFFILLSVVFLLYEKPQYSSLALAIAVMFKQEALFVLPAFLIWYAKDYRKDMIKIVGIFLLVVLAISSPFRLISPNNYITAVSYGTIGNAHIPPLDPGYKTTTNPPIQTHALSCSNIGEMVTTLVCNYGSLTYTETKAPFSVLELFSAGFLNLISFWVAIPMLALASFFLYTIRKEKSAFLIAGALSSLVFLSIFSFGIHAIYRYYLIPDYLLLLVACPNRKSILITLIVSSLSLFLPSGPFQFIPILIVMLAILLSHQDIAKQSVSSSLEIGAVKE